MNRRSVLLLGMASIFGGPLRSARATSPDPTYVAPAVIVIRFDVASKDDAVLKLPIREQIQARLVEYVRSELARASLDIPVVDASSFRQPANLPSEFVLAVDCRVDVAVVAKDGQQSRTIGAVSVVLRRPPITYLSSEPFEFFEMHDHNNSEFLSAIEMAAQRALERSVINPVVLFNR